MERINKKQVLIAFLDILGTSQLLNTGKFQKVYDYYSDMIKLCDESYTPITVFNPLFGKKELFGELNSVMEDLADFDTPYHIINYDLSHAFFSDTFLLWIEIDSFWRSGTPPRWAVPPSTKHGRFVLFRCDGVVDVREADSLGELAPELKDPIRPEAADGDGVLHGLGEDKAFPVLLQRILKGFNQSSS